MNHRVSMHTRSQARSGQIDFIRAIFRSHLVTRCSAKPGSSPSRRLHHRRGKRCNSGEERRGGLARVLDEDLVHDDQTRHGLDDRDGTRDDTRVVPAPSSQSSRSAVILGGFLCLRDRRGGFKANPIPSSATVRSTRHDKTHLK